MSTDLLEVRGTYEHHGGAPGERTVDHIPCIMSVNSFYGGAVRGPCVQMTIQGDHQYIQLDRLSALQLAGVLVSWAAGSL